MYFSQYVAAAILAAVPSIAAHIAPAPWNNITVPYTTQTVTAYKTYFPTPTQFTQGNTTYTVTQKSWVTITDCPEECTITFAPGPHQTVAPVTSCTASEPESASSTGSSGSPSSTGSTGSTGTGAGSTSGSSSSNSTGSGTTGSGATGSGNSTSTGSGSGSGSNGTGSAGSGFNGSSVSGNQNNTPAETISSGAKLSASISGLAIAALCFIAL